MKINNEENKLLSSDEDENEQHFFIQANKEKETNKNREYISNVTEPKSSHRNKRKLSKKNGESSKKIRILPLKIILYYFQVLRKPPHRKVLNKKRTMNSKK